jgi:hypothetical protein
LIVRCSQLIMRRARGPARHLRRRWRQQTTIETEESMASNLTDEQIEALVRDTIRHANLTQNERAAALAWLDKLVGTNEAVTRWLKGQK